MKSLNPSPRALSVCATALLLASCGGGQVAGLSSTQQFANSTESKLAASRLSGGTFKASYSGHYLRYSDHEGVLYEFRGSGAASFLHRSHERFRWAFVLGLSGKTSSYTITLKSSKSPTDRIKVTVGQPPAPCGSNSYVVTGGHGRFAHATGSGTINITCKSSDYTYTDAWTGTLYY